MRKCICVMMCIAILFGLVAWSVPPVQATASSPDQEFEGLHKQLQNDSSEEETTPAKEYPGGYALLNLQVQNKVATVEYSAREDATVIVALYTEDGKQLVTSASAAAPADGSLVEIPLESTTSYFQAAAYLVRTADLSPLCDALKTSRYTKDMQNLMKSTVKNYPAKQVINLDEDTKTNFIVLQEGVVQIQSTDTANRFTTVDQENHRYVIEDADATVTGLQPGSIFACKLADALIATEVTDVEVAGTTVTIRGAEVQAQRIFSHVKIETTGTADQVHVDESTLGEGVTYHGLVPADPAVGQETAWTNKRVNSSTPLEPDSFFQTEDGLSINMFRFELKPEPIPTDFDDGLSSELKFEAFVDVGLKLKHDFYWVNNQSVTDVRIDSGICTEATLEHDFKGKACQLGRWTWTPIFGVDIGFEPYIGVDITGSVTAKFRAVHTTAIYYDTTANSYAYSTPSPKVETDLELKGEMFVGLDFNPTVEVAQGLLLDGDIKAMVGMFFTGELKGTAHGDVATPPEDETKPKPKEVHSCVSCIDGDVSIGIKLGLELTIGGMCLVHESQTEYTRFFHLSDFYFCLIGRPKIPPYGLGSCPDRKFLVTVEVLDVDGNAVGESKVVAAKPLDLLNSTAMGKTNENGVVKNYLPAGVYLFNVGGQTRWTNPIHITGPGKVRIDGNRLIYAPSEPGASLAPLLEKVLDAGEVAGQGTSDGGNIQWTVTTGGFLQITGTGEITESPWTQTVRTIRVISIDEGITGIGPSVFNQSGAICVQLPSTLKTIGERAFYYTDITTISLTNVTDIGREAFYGCSNLQSVIFPEAINTLGTDAFAGCRSLDNVMLPTNLTRIEDGVFRNCESLANISVSNKLSYVGNNAFSGCEKLSYIRITENLANIGSNAFSSCAFTQVELLNDDAQVGPGVFSGCQELQSVRLPANLQTIPYGLFSGCISLEAVNIPAGVTVIDSSAFRNCKTLDSVTIPGKVTQIGNEAFYGCKALTTIRIPTTVTEIGEAAFRECESLRSIGLPKGITQVPEQLFYYCTSLEQVDIPSTVTTIGNSAFYNSGLVDLKLPLSVSELGWSVFQNCTKLRTVVIPEATKEQPGLTEIPMLCFADCTSLVSVTLPTQVNSIGTQAFQNCFSLPAIQLPDAVTELSGWVFDGCSSLQSVKVSPKLTSIETAAFQECFELQSIDLGNQLTSIANHAFYGSGLTSIKIPESVTEIGYSNFSRCENLQTVEFSGNVEYFGDSMFMYCPSLVSVELPGNIKTLPYRTFYGCTSLVSVSVPDGVETIGSNCFIDCTALESVDIPDSVKTFEYSSFQGCENLCGMDFPYGVTTIDGFAFNGCDSLTTITLPSTLTGMGTYAFGYCKNLKSAYFEGNAPAGSGWFLGNTMTVYIPEGDDTWTQEVKDNAEWIGFVRELTWVTYNPPVAASPAIATTAPAVSQDRPASAEVKPAQPEWIQASALEATPGGQYTQQTVDNKVVRTAAYTDLVPGQNYLLLVVANATTQPLLTNQNVLYVTQVTADDQGKLSHSYIQRTETALSFVLLCGATIQSLKDATVTFAPMMASDAEQAVDPVVTYQGKRLKEGVDYRLEGDVTYTRAGTYTCILRGIGAYTGTVRFTYTVEDYLRGDIDGDGSLTTGDAVYLLLHVMFGQEDYPVIAAMHLDMNNDGELNTNDAVYLLLHVMFGEADYPLQA